MCHRVFQVRVKSHLPPAVCGLVAGTVLAHPQVPSVVSSVHKTLAGIEGERKKNAPRHTVRVTLPAASRGSRFVDGFHDCKVCLTHPHACFNLDVSGFMYSTSIIILPVRMWELYLRFVMKPVSVMCSGHPESLSLRS